MTAAPELFPVLEALDFDVKTGITLCGGDEQFYCELIEELHADVLSRRRQALQDAQRRRDYAHMLKGALQTLGQGTVSLKARQLELAIREGRAHEDLMNDLLGELDRMDRALGLLFKPE